jgi:hypothetical protein
MCSLGTNSCIFSIIYCNILSVHCCNLLLFISRVVIILLFQNFVKTMYNMLMINKAQVSFFIHIYPFQMCLSILNSIFHNSNSYLNS